ncbi:MAG: hypothetical protein R2939_02265 [Kofleriaceae bacterium]
MPGTVATTVAVWGFASASATLVGILVAAVVVGALVYLGRRAWRARRE